LIVIRTRIIGAGGFGGANIIELLTAHPEAEIVSLVDVDGVGQPISAKHTHLKGICDLPVSAPDEAPSDDSVDVAFAATPDGVGMKLADDCLAGGARLIDYSGDFRFNTAEAYAGYAARIGRGPDHAAAGLLPRSVYGLAELHRPEIAEAAVVGNPGCFAVSAILGAAPAVREGLIELDSIICDAKTGVSGAGIKPAQTFHYPLRYENMNAYKIAAHQHNFEIERELSLVAGSDLQVTLTTQVVPLCRGIMTTVYGQLANRSTTAEQLYEAYAAFYRDSAFVRVEPQGVPTSNNDVRGSNFSVLSINADPRTGRMIVVSHIDNLMKGQAGSALQNMNVMFGLDETLGLKRPPFYP
jgi:N-acetyl-gamma-glutamyl-phosphate reductase